jgi:hypothetical protein
MGRRKGKGATRLPTADYGTKGGKAETLKAEMLKGESRNRRGRREGRRKKEVTVISNQ